jgi:phosphoglycerate dehydrogenase-like enzyme
VTAGTMKVVTSVYSDPTWTLPPAEVARLRRDFPHIAVVDAPSREGRLRELPDADVAFLSQLTPDEFAAAARLRWVQSPAAGVAGLLFPQLRDSPVVLTNARGIHGDAMAEHVIGVAIVLFRQLHRSIRRQAGSRWDKDPQTEFRMLRGSRMAVIGLGAVGQAVAERAAAMGMDVVAVRRTPSAPRPASVSAVYPPGDLDAVLAAADVVVLTAPLTGETRGLIGRAQLRRMKRDAILINVSRGKLVNEDELAAELAGGTIAGAALDVFEHEPLEPGSPLWQLSEVVITPHTSAFRSDYWTLAVDLFASNLGRFERGDPLVNVVDKAAGY